MERFKFRVWSNKHNRYIVDSHYPIGSDHIIVIKQDGKVYNLGLGDYEDDSNVHSWGVIEEFADCVVEQCTGLKDKNGNLIYEGDIVLAKYSYKSRPEKLIVKWGQGVFHTITAGFWLFDFSPITLETAKKGEDFPESSEIEIIGNIHEQKDNK